MRVWRRWSGGVFSPGLPSGFWSDVLLRLTCWLLSSPDPDSPGPAATTPPPSSPAPACWARNSAKGPADWESWWKVPCSATVPSLMTRMRLQAGRTARLWVTRMRVAEDSSPPGPTTDRNTCRPTCASNAAKGSSSRHRSGLSGRHTNINPMCTV